MGAVLAPSLDALAQDSMMFLNEANGQIRSVGSIVYQIVMGVLALIAIVSLITVALKMNSSDRDATIKALGWFGGMLFCMLMATVIKSFMGV